MTKEILFSEVQIAKRALSKRKDSAEKLEIAFISNSIEEFDLTYEKDGFDNNTLEKIFSTGKNVGLCVRDKSS